jgi:hypothetical protein
MSKNAENVSPHHRAAEIVRTASGRAASGKRVTSSGSITSVKEGRIRKASGVKEKVGNANR